MNEFGNRLKKIRIEKNMSQKDFASRANIDKSMMCRYENGEKRPTYEALCSIAREHNISLDYLCGLQQSGTVSLIGLTDGQADCVRLLIDAFHEYNNTVRKRLSDEQYRVLRSDTGGISEINAKHRLHENRAGGALKSYKKKRSRAVSFPVTA